MTEHEWFLLVERQRAEIGRLEDEVDELKADIDGLLRYCELLEQGAPPVSCGEPVNDAVARLVASGMSAHGAIREMGIDEFG